MSTYCFNEHCWTWSSFKPVWSVFNWLNWIFTFVSYLSAQFIPYVCLSWSVLVQFHFHTMCNRCRGGRVLSAELHKAPGVTSYLPADATDGLWINTNKCTFLACAVLVRSFWICHSVHYFTLLGDIGSICCYGAWAAGAWSYMAGCDSLQAGECTATLCIWKCLLFAWLWGAVVSG